MFVTQSEKNDKNYEKKNLFHVPSIKIDEWMDGRTKNLL